ncbi:MAG: MOSC domain-containing protein [Gammaproteobacteria bacterium]|nr:MOSC domain-containing protein [Gammaproteobacteria bacterium]
MQLNCAHALVGDQFAGRANSSRQVTLIQQQHLAVIATCIGRGIIDPALLRRNIVVFGTNLPALQDRRFRIGDAPLESSGACHPDSNMERVPGVGDISARVNEAGRVRIRDRLFHTR